MRKETPESAASPLRSSRLQSGSPTYYLHSASSRDSSKDFLFDAGEKLQACEEEDTEEIECVLRNVYEYLRKNGFEMGQLNQWNALMGDIVVNSSEDKLKVINESVIPIFEGGSPENFEAVLAFFRPYLRAFDKLGSYAKFSIVRCVYSKLKAIFQSSDREKRKQMVAFLSESISKNSLREYDFWFLKECQTEKKKRTSARSEITSMGELGKSSQDTSIPELTVAFRKQMKNPSDGLMSEKYLLVEARKSAKEGDMYLEVDAEFGGPRKVNKALF